MTTLREAAQQALEALTPWMDSDHTVQHAAYHALRTALAKQRLTDAQQEMERSIESLKAALAQQAEPVEPVQEPITRLFGTLPVHDAQQAEPVEPVAWLRVIDEAMVTHHLGVADPGDDYETAKRKMNNLLCMAQDIGTYFAKQAEPVEPVAWVRLEAWKSGQSWPDDCFTALPAEGLTPLYTAPPQRKPLTEEEIDALPWNGSPRQFARAVERALEEKNRGR